MIRRVGKNLALMPTSLDDVSPAAVDLERDGYAVLRRVLSADEIGELSDETDRLFRDHPPERERVDRDEFRYAVLNRSEPARRAMSHPRILAAIEPLLGGDCHVIANTLWHNTPEFAGGPWHCDAGPHVPRPADVPWDDRIPYPVFAIGAHLLLRECRVPDGPTAVVPGSHRSGRLAPSSRIHDPELTFDGRLPVLLEGAAGDVALFVSDAWHRGTPASGGRGRLFLQVHYGRRDIAQRILTTDLVNHLSAEAAEWADTTRRRDLVGLHDPYFYDG